MIIDRNLCNDLLAIQLQNGVLDLSWGIDTDTLMKDLKDNEIDKILDFNGKVDFVIQIDNVDTFDSVNKKEYIFSEIEQTYSGKIVYSCVINFNKNQFEETTYYFRVKLTPISTDFSVKKGNAQFLEKITFNEYWSEPLKFTIKKDFTNDIVNVMYRMVADANAYNKEVKSANFYYLLQASADTINKEYQSILEEKEKHFLNKAHPDSLANTFGELFNFIDIEGISMEEYRRILRELIIGYQNGGAWNYICKVLKYLIGYTPTLTTLESFYPWVLRKGEEYYFDKNGQVIVDDQNNPVKQRPDPTEFTDRNYFNPDSNYYLYTTKFLMETVPSKVDPNKIMLFKKGEKIFTFIINVDNFYNLKDIDAKKIKTILDILKSVYTKYELFISSYEEPISFDNLLLADDSTYLIADENDAITY